jgi:hypothetical protein
MISKWYHGIKIWGYLDQLAVGEYSILLHMVHLQIGYSSTIRIIMVSQHMRSSYDMSICLVYQKQQNP